MYTHSASSSFMEFSVEEGDRSTLPKLTVLVEMFVKETSFKVEVPDSVVALTECQKFVHSSA